MTLRAPCPYRHPRAAAPRCCRCPRLARLGGGTPVLPVPRAHGLLSSPPTCSARRRLRLRARPLLPTAAPLHRAAVAASDVLGSAAASPACSTSTAYRRAAAPRSRRRLRRARLGGGFACVFYLYCLPPRRCTAQPSSPPTCSTRRWHAHDAGAHVRFPSPASSAAPSACSRNGNGGVRASAMRHEARWRTLAR